jgi:hypothetical protein
MYSRGFHTQQPYRMVRSISIPLFLDQVGRLDVLRAEIDLCCMAAFKRRLDVINRGFS